MRAEAPRLFAAFSSARALEGALAALRGAGVSDIVTYTPTPLSAPTDVSPVGFVGAVTGVAGFAGAFAMEAYANVWGYPLDIGGRPKFSWPSFAPIALEVGILFAVLGVFVCVLVAAPLLRFYEAVDDCDLLRRASTDQWIVAVASENPLTIARVRETCESSGAREIRECR